ncbi:MAG TPA: hypothetical protein VK694_01210 [Verrucomicrobiae bacterium]|nr:hypothetical protein [Verrucomicrobiae bacterium]
MARRSLLQAGFSVVELLIGLLIIGAIGFAGWLFFDRQQPTPATTQPDTAAQLGAEVLVDIGKRVTSKYDYLAADSSWVAQMGSGAALQPDGYKFRVNSESFPSLHISYKANAASDAPLLPQTLDPAVQLAMENAGYYRASGEYDLVSTQSTSDLKYSSYSTDESTCLYIQDTQRAATISCFTKDELKQAAVTASPYITSYLDAQPHLVANQLTFGPVTIKSQTKSGVIGASETAGYDIAEAVIAVDGSKKLVLYYSQQGGPWKYIAQADDEYGFRCQVFMANEDVRKALHGQVCLGDTGHVRLDSTRRALQ